MEVLRTAAELRTWARGPRAAGQSIGLVPTMGALHEGHASLIRASVQGNDVTIVSIFVNPVQFGPSEDIDAYPRTFDADLALCEKEGVDVVYAPSARDMYPEGYATYVSVEALTEGLCGASRPGHFRGVATVVAKLFIAAAPDRAYFGQKDAQQFAVIQRMASDLDFGIEIIELPTVRDTDGLALSSRNRYLSAKERKEALRLPRALEAGYALLKAGERDAGAIVSRVREELNGLRVDYVELVDGQTMAPLEEARGSVLLAAAAHVGQARLIDNIRYEVPES